MLYCKLKKNPLLILGFIILFASAIMIYFGSYKEYLYIDEVLSYTAANNKDAYYMTIEEGKWYTAEDIYEDVTAVNTAWNYNIVIDNQSSDVHPPVYHILLHTICSVFPTSFSKWFGIGLNIFCFLLTMPVLYLTGKLIWQRGANAKCGSGSHKLFCIWNKSRCYGTN